MDEKSAFPYETDTTSEPNGFSIITPSVDSADTPEHQDRSEIEPDLDKEEGPDQFAIEEQMSESCDKNASSGQSIEGQVDSEPEKLIGVALTFEKGIDISHKEEIMSVITKAVELELALHSKLDVGRISTTTLEESTASELQPFNNDLDRFNLGAHVAPEQSPPEWPPEVCTWPIPESARPVKDKLETATSLKNDLTKARILDHLSQCARYSHPCACKKDNSAQADDTMKDIQSDNDGETPPIAELVGMAQAQVHHLLTSCKHGDKGAKIWGVSARLIQRIAHTFMNASVFLLCLVVSFYLYHTMSGKLYWGNASRQCLGIWVGK